MYMYRYLLTITKFNTFYSQLALYGDQKSKYRALKDFSQNTGSTATSVLRLPDQIPWDDIFNLT